MFGEASVPKIFKGEKLYVTVNNVKANVDLSTLVSMQYTIMLFSKQKSGLLDVRNKCKRYVRSAMLLRVTLQNYTSFLL